MSWDAEKQRQFDELRARELEGPLSEDDQRSLDALLTILDAEEARYLAPAIDKLEHDSREREAQPWIIEGRIDVVQEDGELVPGHAAMDDQALLELGTAINDRGGAVAPNNVELAIENAADLRGEVGDVNGLERVQPGGIGPPVAVLPPLGPPYPPAPSLNQPRFLTRDRSALSGDKLASPVRKVFHRPSSSRLVVYRRSGDARIETWRGSRRWWWTRMSRFRSPGSR